MEPVVNQIKNSLMRPVCSGWDRGFLESVLEQIDRGRTLSTKQMSTLNQVLERNSSDAQKEHEVWADVYMSEYKSDAEVLARYYKSTGYFQQLASTILSGEVPEHKSFMKMRNNKYARKVLDVLKTDAKYDVGTYVLPRASCTKGRIRFDDSKNFTVPWSHADSVFKSFKDKGGFVMALHDTIYSAANGAKTYKILPIGATIPFIVEERYIKVKR